MSSPYDYRRNTLLYVPQDLPVPGRTAEGFTEAVLEAALPVAAAAGGRAFFLFTSYRALDEAREILSGIPAWEGRFVAQGAGRSRALLLEQFRSRKDCILLGTRSFWQGVDVRGQDLILVVIDRLPFEAPGNPVLPGPAAGRAGTRGRSLQRDFTSGSRTCTETGAWEGWCAANVTGAS